MSEIKVVIFDMDGTLYHEDSFAGRYVKYMLEDRYESEDIESIIEEAYAILSGEHAARIGKVYDRKTDLLYDHFSLTLQEATTWSGKRVEAVKPHNKDLMFIGDAWDVAKAVGFHYGATEEDRLSAFTRVREEMLTKEYAIPLAKGIGEVIETLPVEQTIIMTNSPFESGEVFLEYMGILPLFDQAKYSGNKPLGMYELIHELLDKGYQPNEILSIGDNGFNDLYPAYTNGAKTVYISHYPSVNHPEWNMTVNNLNELTTFLKYISMNKGGALNEKTI